jgi:tRNA-binding EMAP/Myf-like protein
MVGKKIIVIANLKPARFAGVTSDGMLLAATNNACGCQVKRLVRVRIMNIRLGNLKTGAYRQITKEEYGELTGLLKDSSSLSVKERKNR